MKYYENFIFDLDDTLLRCGIYYKNKIDELIEFCSKRTGFKPDICKRLFTSIEKERLQLMLPDGYSKQGFPRSFAALSITLDVISGNNIDENAAHQCYLIGESVFSEEYPLFESTSAVLDILKNNNKQLFIYSKGDYQIQTNKIVKNDLMKYFPLSHVYIVPHKGHTYIKQIFEDHFLDPQSTIVIGDSLVDDIISANSMNCDSVWVREFSWDHIIDTENKIPTYTIQHIDELLKIGEVECQEQRQLHNQQH